jgi:hypothetical protein
MKRTFFAICILFTSTLAQSQSASTVIAPPNADSSGCDLAVPGIDKEKFLTFFSKLKAAASTKDSSAMSALVHYPLTVNSVPKRKIKSTADFKKNFPILFDSQILGAVSKQEIKDLFCRDQGVMIGHGQLWIDQRGDKVGISTINPDK